MTQIAYMAGVGAPANEWNDRGKNIPSRSYIPFFSMTKGEMQLALALENARMTAGFYPESKTDRERVVMLENALYKGIHFAPSFIGSIPPALQSTAALIKRESRNNRPASRLGALPRKTPGVYIGDPIVPVKFANIDCLDYIYPLMRDIYNKDRDNLPLWKKPILAPFPKRSSFAASFKYFPIKKYREMFTSMLLDCEYKKAVEVVLNTNLETSSPHMLYHQMSASFEPALGTLAITKRLLHKAGVGDIAKLSGVDTDQMALWVETGIRRSSITRGIAPDVAYSNVLTTALLPPGVDPEKWANQVLADIKKRGGAASVGVVLTTAAIVAILGAIATALKAAADMQRSLNEKKIAALQNANGFGTTAFQPEKEDFLKAKGDTPLTIPSDNSLLLLLGGGAALYFLSK